MKTALSLSALLLAFVGLEAKTYKPLTLAGEVISTFEAKANEHTPQEMVTAAEAFIKALSEEERKQLILPLDDPERKKWTNVPTKANDGGLRLGDLKKEPLQAACQLLATVLSDEGYAKAREVMLADDLLLKSKKQAQRRGGFGCANFWLMIFGEPSATEPWAIQLDGHHIAFNLTILGEKVSMSPSFIGTQPHKFTLGEKEILPMGDETAAAFAFMASLSPEQQNIAIQEKKRGRLQTGPGTDGNPFEVTGLSAETLNEKQKNLLLDLIGLWVDDLPKQASETRLKEIEAQLDQTTFLWKGPVQPNSDASFHIFGPGIIIEYAGQNLGGDPLDHLHSIYRDPTNEYGVKWLTPKEGNEK